MWFIHSYPSGAIRKKVGYLLGKGLSPLSCVKKSDFSVSLRQWFSSSAGRADNSTYTSGKARLKEVASVCAQGNMKRKQQILMIFKCVVRKISCHLASPRWISKTSFYYHKQYVEEELGGVQWRSCFGLDMGGLPADSVAPVVSPSVQSPGWHRWSLCLLSCKGSTAPAGGLLPGIPASQGSTAAFRLSYLHWMYSLTIPAVILLLLGVYLSDPDLRYSFSCHACPVVFFELAWAWK